MTSTAAVRRALVVVTALLFASALVALPVVRDRAANDEARPISVHTLAASASAAARTDTFAMEMSTDVTVGDQHVRSVTRSRLDNPGQRGSFTFVIPGIGSLEGVMSDGRMYIELPAKARASAGGKQWVSAAVPPNDTAQNPATTGTNLLSYLAGAKGPVTVVGRERVRKVQTTHYRVVLDIDRLLAAGRQQQEGLGFVMPDATMPTVKSDPAGVWLDDQRRIRRYEVVTRVLRADGRTAGTTKIRTEYFDYGIPVTVHAPPSQDVFEVPTVAAAFQLIGRAATS